MVWTGLGLWFAGAAWYFYELRRGVYRLHPVQSYVLMGAGLGLGAAAVGLSPTVGKGAGLGVLLLLTGIFLYWMWVYSVAPGSLRVRVGEPMPDFEVPDSRGGTFRPREGAGRRAALYVFYRGYW